MYSKEKKKPELIETGNRLMVARGEGQGVHKMGEGDQRYKLLGVK